MLTTSSVGRLLLTQRSPTRPRCRPRRRRWRAAPGSPRRRPQRAVDVADEVRVAGRVEQVDLVARPLELRQPQVDGHLALDSHRARSRGASCRRRSAPGGWWPWRGRAWLRRGASCPRRGGRPERRCGSGWHENRFTSDLPPQVGTVVRLRGSTGGTAQASLTRGCCLGRERTMSRKPMQRRNLTPDSRAGQDRGSIRPHPAACRYSFGSFRRCPPLKACFPRRRTR